MDNLKISVILPNYNSEKHLAKAITGFLNQDYANKELIVVDGKSTDSSHRIIKDFILKSDSIKWIKEKDTNVTDAINIGLKYCTGDFISFLASDVFYYSDDLFSVINRNYGLVKFDGIYFDYYCHYTNQSEIYLLKCPNVIFNKNNLLMYGTIAGFDNVFLSRRIYEKQRYNPDYNLCSDWEFFLRITQAERLLFLYVEKAGTINVQDGNNLSLKFQHEQMRQIKEVGKLYNTDNVKLYFDRPALRTYFKKFLVMLYKRVIR